jgi:hypothetical protein
MLVVASFVFGQARSDPDTGRSPRHGLLLGELHKWVGVIEHKNW